MKRSSVKTAFWCFLHPCQSADLLALTESFLDKATEKLQEALTIHRVVSNELQLLRAVCNEHGFDPKQKSNLENIVLFVQNALKEKEELRQENDDLKNINQRLHEKINLLQPQGLREPFFPTSYRMG